MTPKKCMSIAKSLTNTQHMELEPLCTVHNFTQLVKGQMKICYKVIPLWVKFDLIF